MSSLTGDTLNDLAKIARERIVGDRAVGTEPHEETLTQNLVSELLRRTRDLGLEVVAREISRHEEAVLGADVVVWFQNADGEMAGVHMQAKRQYKDDTYRGIDHVNSRGRQYDLLIQGARASHAGAAYVFYNGLADDEPQATVCSRNIVDADSNGVTMVDAELLAEHVKATLARAEIEALCAPLRCLVECASVVHQVDPDDPAAVIAGWQSWFATRELISEAEAPSYLVPLIEALNSREPTRLDSGGTEPSADAAEVDPSDEGGDFVTVALVRAPQ